MKQKETIWQSNVQADIFSPDFYAQLGLENTELPPKDQPFYYDLDVTVSLATSQMEDRIERYCYRRPIRQRATASKDKYGAILGEQINEVLLLFREMGYALKNVEICAEPMENPQEVILALSKGPNKEYDKKGNPKSVFILVSIIPNGPGFRANLKRFVSELPLKPMKEEIRKQTEPPKPSAEMISLETLFLPIAQEIAANSQAETDPQMIVDSMKSNYHVRSMQPFSMYGRRGLVNPVEKQAKEVPAPAWLLYTEKSNSEWSIVELKSGLEAQYELERIWKRKTTHTAFVLHDLHPVSYTLFGKQEQGYLKISKLEASHYPALRVIWDNGIT